MKTLLMKLLAREGCVSMRLRLPLLPFSWQCDTVPISEMLRNPSSFCKPLKRVFFSAQSNCAQIWDPLGDQVNLCIQIKHSLKNGWDPMSKLCWGGCRSILFVVGSGGCSDRPMWIQSKRLFSSAGRWFRHSLVCSCLVSRVAPQPSGRCVKGELLLLQGFPSVDSRGCVKQANSLITFSSQIVWLINGKRLNISTIFSTCVSDLIKGLHVQKLICLFQLQQLEKQFSRLTY